MREHQPIFRADLARHIRRYVLAKGVLIMISPMRYLRALMLTIGLLAWMLSFGPANMLYGQAVNGTLLGTITDASGL